MSASFPEAEKTAIMKALDEGLAALAASDVPTWLSYWTEDAVSMVPGKPMYKGHAGLKEQCPSICGHTYVLSDIRIEGCGDLAVVYTTLTFPREGGAPLPAKQILVMRKRGDGRWQVAANSVSLDVPGEVL